MLLENKYNLGDLVYLKTDVDQELRMVTAIQVCLDKGMIYSLSLGANETKHYELEISKTKNYANV